MLLAEPDVDELTDLEDEFAPKCEHHLHGKDTQRHNNSDAEYDLLYPCGFTQKVCAGWIRYIIGGGQVKCGQGVTILHDRTNCMWTPL
jgi:hypothetical protein